MSDELAAKDAEIIDMNALVKPNDKPMLRIAEGLNSFNWRDMKPPHMALLLMQKPYPVRGGGTTHLTFPQAIFFATRCYELGVSPFSNEVWFDPNRYAVNLTLEGKRQLAQNRNISIGPPQFEEIERPWDKVPRITDAGKEAQKAFKTDVGIKCRMRVGNHQPPEYTEYIAYLSEWYVASSPMWKEKPIHMLQVRAQEKALTMAIGTGSSVMPSEGEIE